MWWSGSIKQHKLGILKYVKVALKYRAWVNVLSYFPLLCDRLTCKYWVLSCSCSSGCGGTDWISGSRNFCLCRSLHFPPDDPDYTCGEGHVHSLWFSSLFVRQSPSLPLSLFSTLITQICEWHVSLHLARACIAYGHCIMASGPR